MTTPTNYSTFYTPPTPLPSNPAGSIIATQASNLATLTVTIPATATRVMYLSTDSLGNPNAVIGTYFEPTKAWTGVGARPLISMGPGTMGQGDQCAPSRLFNQVIFCGGQKNIMAEYQAANVADKVKQGIAVFVTDYENLGTSFATGKAPTFGNRLAQGHAVIDGAKAALNLPGTSLTGSSKIIFWGYDQGAGASGAAAELLATYGASLSHVVGAYCGSPPSNFFDLITNIDSSAAAGIVAFLLNGFKVSYPSNVSAINAAMTSLGTSFLVNSQNMCILESAMTYGFQPLAQYFIGPLGGTTACQTLDQVIQLLNKAPFYAMLNAQGLGTVAPGCPVLIDINGNDPFTSFTAATQLAQAWTTLGGNVQLYTSTTAIPTLGLSKTGLIHYVAAQSDDAISLQWCSNLFNGVAPSPNPSAIGTARTAAATLACTATLTSSGAVV
jgi:triacylglycerol lipase